MHGVTEIFTILYFIAEYKKRKEGVNDQKIINPHILCGKFSLCGRGDRTDNYCILYKMVCPFFFLSIADT